MGCPASSSMREAHDFRLCIISRPLCRGLNQSRQQKTSAGYTMLHHVAPLLVIHKFANLYLESLIMQVSTHAHDCQRTDEDLSNL